MKRKLLLITILILANSFVAHAQQEGAPFISRFALPGRTWAVQMQTDGFVQQGRRIIDDGEGRYVIGQNETTNMVISIFLEKAPKQGDSLAAREYYWSRERRSPFHMESVKMSEMGPLAIVEYMVREAEGLTVNQKNYHVYLAREDVWVDIHLSKINYTHADDDLFASVLRSIKIDEHYTTPRMLYIEYGSHFYQQENYRKAIEHYRAALEMERRQPILDETMFRVLVDNLGMAYGISGDLANAKATFEYGLTRDATYPLFYYNLAATYAEMNDLDNAIAYLKKAFQYRNNIIRGEHMPDPRTDSSFKRFLQNERFRQTLREIE